jgi:hypothetical protein
MCGHDSYCPGAFWLEILTDRDTRVRFVIACPSPSVIIGPIAHQLGGRIKKGLIVFGGLVLAAGSVIASEEGFKVIKELLTGYQEVPVVSTTGHAAFSARISSDETSIEYTMTYGDFEGTVTQSHIHVGQPGVNGGISVFLCSNLGNGPAGTQLCPASGTISGVITAADVSPSVAATGAARTQGINTGELEELIAAIRAGATYVNIHSTLWPGGEVRSQIDGNSGHQY